MRAQRIWQVQTQKAQEDLHQKASAWAPKCSTPTVLAWRKQLNGYQHQGRHGIPSCPGRVNKPPTQKPTETSTTPHYTTTSRGEMHVLTHLVRICLSFSISPSTRAAMGYPGAPGATLLRSVGSPISWHKCLHPAMAPFGGEHAAGAMHTQLLAPMVGRGSCKQSMSLGVTVKVECKCCMLLRELAAPSASKGASSLRASLCGEHMA